MNTLIEKSKYLGGIAVITLLVSFALALLWGVANAVFAWIEIITSYGKSEDISLLLIKLIDAFLLALILYILAASVYTLFFGGLRLPSRLVAHDLPELKSKLSSIVILVITVRFTEYLFEGNMQPQQVLTLGIAIALVAAVLIAFIYVSNHNGYEEHAER